MVANWSVLVVSEGSVFEVSVLVGPFVVSLLGWALVPGCEVLAKSKTLWVKTDSCEGR